MSKHVRLAASGLCMLVLFAWGQARSEQPFPNTPSEKPGTLGKGRTVRGIVKRFTTDVRTDVINGMVLDNGTIVHWWPHLAKRFLGIVHKGDSVEVVGRWTTIERTQTVLEAETITNLSTAAKRLNADTPPVPVDGTTKTVRGTVTRLTTAPGGAVTGMELSDGVTVRWPVALEKRFTLIAQKGDRVEVTGRLESTPRGDTLLEARTITNLTTSKVATADVAPPVGAPPVAAPLQPVLSTQGDLEKRVRILEDRLDRLTREVELMRRQK